MFCREETKKIITIAVPIVGGIIILAILLSLFAYYCSRRAKSKENTAKLTARMTGVAEDEVFYYNAILICSLEGYPLEAKNALKN